jgi:hypothetical protein
LTSDGFWDWNVPLHTDCWGNDLPGFRKGFVNRNGFGNRDKITVDSLNSEFLYSFVNQDKQSECNDWLHGYGFNNSFNVRSNDVFSPWSNPPAKTWDGQPTEFLMEVINQSGSIVTARFETQNAFDGKPSKPSLGLDPKAKNNNQNSLTYLAWGSDVWDLLPIEPDINWSELQLSTDSTVFTTIYSGINRFWSDSTLANNLNGISSAQFRVRVRDNQNNWSMWSDPVNIKLNNQSITNSSLDPVTSFNLSQNFPNPFNPSTNIKYSVSQLSTVEIKVFDILGSEVATLVNEEKEPGVFTVTFDASTFASGVYFYQLKAGEFISTKKMILLK